jgi:hypothetical protein
MSQLLARLYRELQVATDVVKRAEIRARIASYLARVGKFAETRQIISELRLEFGDCHNGHVTAWIMLTEGLLHLYENLSPLALDRVAGSQALGLAMHDASIAAVASAWKAHLEFETSNFDAMVKSLRLAIAHAGEHDHDAHARLAMVISDSFRICGEKRRAQAWFLCSHDHALKDGDHASIEALLYNRAAFSLARIRVERCLGDIDVNQLSLLRLDIASARNLQSLIDVSAFTNFIHLCDARMLILEESYAEAIETLGVIRNARPFAKYNFSQSFVDLELAFCLQHLGRMEEARSIYSSIAWSSFDGLDVDEKLVAAWMQHVMCGADESLGSLDEAKVRLGALTMKYEDMRLKLLTSLQPFQEIA